ncbi:alpha/beta-hydrolase [Jackrogersella minutella]|nr:alpha/beta-hydrolase [Jackrogersella minutella]
MATDTSTTGHITVADGVRLRYWQDGPVSGPNIVFIAGWAQTAASFKKQVSYFKTAFRVTTYDNRGHGESDKPSFGYRVPRLAADLDAVLTQLDLRSVTLVGHSMGAAVTWAHWDLFARDRVAKLVFIDQARSLMAFPAWTEREKALAGSVFSPEQVFEFVAALRGPQWKETRAAMARRFYTDDFAPEDFEWALQESLKTPPEIAAEMMASMAMMDWGDVFPRINVPTLVFHAKANLMPIEAGEWIAKQVPNARCVSFEKEEKGSHFMFFENPEKFNRVLEEFLNE